MYSDHRWLSVGGGREFKRIYGRLTLVCNAALQNDIPGMCVYAQFSGLRVSLAANFVRALS